MIRSIKGIIVLSNLSPLSTSVLPTSITNTQQQIDNILKTLATGLSVNSSSDDPANLYISSRLNAQSLDAATASTNAQNGLTYLQVVQQAYDDIYTELNKIKDIATGALTGVYTSSQRQAFQDSISESINKIKFIEESTMFNDLKVFDNSQSAGLVNEHMFGITSKSLTSTTVTTVTSVAHVTVTTTFTGGSGGLDYKSYLSDTSFTRFTQVGGTLVNGVTTLTIGANVVTISSAAQLVSALDNVGAGSLGKVYVLLDNIHLTSLGVQSHALLRGIFAGELKGNGYAILGLQETSTSSAAGLFEELNDTSLVTNLVLEHFTIDESFGHAGALAANARGTITNVAAQNINIAGNSDVGGLVGWNNGNIYKSYSTGTVGNTTNDTVGGLVGYNSNLGKIEESFSTAVVQGSNQIGGLVGINAGTVKASYATGNVIATGGNVGGLIGASYGTVSYTYSTGSVKSGPGGSETTGGLIGNNIVGGNVTQSYSIGAVINDTYPNVGRFQELSLGLPPVIASGTIPGFTFTLNVPSGIHQGNYLFATAQERTNYSEYVAGTANAGPVARFYKTTSMGDPATWYEEFLQYGNGLVGTSAGSIDSNNFYGVQAAANLSYTSEFGVTLLGSEEMLGGSSAPIATWDLSIWDTSGDRPVLLFVPAEGSKSFAENTLPSLPAGGPTYTYTTTYTNSYAYSVVTSDLYHTTSLTLNTALNNYTNTVAAPDFTFISETQALSSGYNAAHIIHTAAEFVSKISNDLSGNFIMVSNIDMSSLGTLTDAAITGNFTGKLDGNGYKVKNLTINTNDAIVSNIALFKTNGVGGVIKNLRMENTSVTAINVNTAAVGSLVGSNNGTILNCSTTTGSIVGGYQSIGGLVGLNTGNISNSSSSINVTGNYWLVGGFVGYSTGTISNSYSTGNVTGPSRTGGFIGQADGGTITNSYSTGLVTSTNEKGGFIGFNNGGTITKSYTSGNVSAGGVNAGGFVGWNMAGSISATSFYKNNMSSDGTSGTAINANVLAQPTSTWSSDIWDLSGSLPVLRDLSSSVAFASNKLISNIKISNAANPNQIFTEGTDYSIYSNDNGTTWEMQVLSNAMFNKNIKIDYEGVPTGTANQSVSGFNLYLGDSKNYNIKDMVLDLAGRLNFNITKNSAQSIVDAVNQTMSYMDIKDIRVEGSITLATNSLKNKQVKTTAISFGSKSLISADEAKQKALLAKKQINYEMANDAMMQFYSAQLSIAETLIGSSGSGYSFSGLDSNSLAVYSQVNTNNKAVQEYYYKSKYGQSST